MARYSKFLVLLTVFAMVFTGCGGDDDDATTTTAAGGGDSPATTEAVADEDPIVFASSLPLTGEFSGVGAKHSDGYKFCVEEINRLGGLLGRQVEIIIEDNRSETETAVSQYERFINVENADVLFGTFSSLLGYPTSSLAEQNGMVMGLPSSGAMRVWARGYENIFYFQQLPAELTGSSIVDLVNHYTETGVINEPLETAAVVDADDFFASAIANGFKGAEFTIRGEGGAEDRQVSLAPGYVSDMGMELVYEETWPVGFTDWLTLANSIAGAEPDFLALTVTSVDELLSMLKALETVGFSPKLMYASQGTQSEVGEELGGIESGLLVHAVWAEEANWEGELAGQPYTNADFISNFTAWSGHSPDEDEAIPFALCQGMEQAILGTGGTDNAAMSAWLHDRDGDPVKTIMGDFVWGEDGLAEERAFLVNQWQDGELKLVFPVGEFDGTADLVFPKP
ncbi:MAG: ABC transporter substrate-binding protein [bacterium]|nr:ABC transporter substrate-binding protein [bacterium]